MRLPQVTALWAHFVEILATLGCPMLPLGGGVCPGKGVCGCSHAPPPWRQLEYDSNPGSVPEGEEPGTPSPLRPVQRGRRVGFPHQAVKQAIGAYEHGTSGQERLGLSNRSRWARRPSVLLGRWQRA